MKNLHQLNSATMLTYSVCRNLFLKTNLPNKLNIRTFSRSCGFKKLIQSNSLDKPLPLSSLHHVHKDVLNLSPIEASQHSQTATEDMFTAELSRTPPDNRMTTSCINQKNDKKFHDHNNFDKILCRKLPSNSSKYLCWSHAFHSMVYHEQQLRLSGVGNCGYLQQSHRNLNFTPPGILDASPKSLQPYLRLIRFDKPIGTWLLFWPCTWSIAMAADPGQFPDLWLLTLFGAGSFFMRGAGCIINDMWDKDIDKMVERTKVRPLASGELNFYQGLGCLAGMLSVSLAILLQLNWFSVFLGASSMGLVILYPLAKRYTYWPQAMLGVTLNWGVLLSWSAIQGSLEWKVFPLYLACVLYTMTYDSIYSHQQAKGLTFNYGAMLGWAAAKGSVDLSVVLPLYVSCMAWTLSYDTIYAHQDKYDDMLIGVKSTALKFGDQTKTYLTGFGCVTVSGLTLSGLMCEQTWPYFVGVGLTASHLAYQIRTVDLENADDCAAKFRSNKWLGLIMFIAVVLGTLGKTVEDNKQETSKESEK